jgi:hypothetical protein
VNRESPATLLDVQSEYSDLDRDQLRQLARENLGRLADNLPESWREYLNTDLLQQLIDDEIHESSGERQKLLREILAKFDATLNSTNVRHVTEAAGFRDLYGALAELSVTPHQRKLAQLVAASEQLKRDLTRINAPANWLTYLHLPVPSLDHEPSDVPEPPVTTGESVAGLEATLRRYDQTAEDPQYRVIAGLTGFQSTRSRLREYLGLLGGSSTPTSPDTFEQLPVPEPDGQPDPVTE